jgi:hypothetical protein
MKWILFTGTWRLTNSEVERDVREAARNVLLQGDGIVTGGAAGVDYFAMDEAFKLSPDASLLKVVIPTNLSNYIHDYRTNWCQMPVTSESISALELLLTKLKKFVQII